MDKKYLYIVILILVIIILIIPNCNRNEAPLQQDLTPKVITEVVKGDSIPYPVKGDPVLVRIESVRDTFIYLNEPVDTLAIVKDYFKMKSDYFAIKVFHDTINEREVEVIIRDKVSRNQIVNRDINIRNLRSKVINRISTQNPMRKMHGVYLGGDIGTSVGLDDFLGRGEISYLNKKGQSFAFGVNFITNSKPVYTIGTKFKIN